MNTYTQNESGDDFKLYSQRAISIATFFGGPLAAGILARRNFINLGKEEYGKHALFISVVATIALFAGLFSLSDEVIDRIPASLIPFVYTLIITGIIHYTQGKDLKAHKDDNRQFYSAWNATGVGFLSMMVLIIGLGAYSLLWPDDFDTEAYDTGLANFNANEEKALELYNMLEDGQSANIIRFVDNVGIPLWRENLSILDSLDKIEGLYPELLQQNEKLKKYCQLRIQAYELMKKAVTERTSEYEPKILDLHSQIETLFE